MQINVKFATMRFKEVTDMYDNQFNITPDEEIDPTGLCPCQNNGCTHACSAAGVGCFRTCSSNCSVSCGGGTIIG